MGAKCGLRQAKPGLGPWLKSIVSDTSCLYGSNSSARIDVVVSENFSYREYLLAIRLRTAIWRARTCHEHTLSLSRKVWESDSTFRFSVLGCARMQIS